MELRPDGTGFSGRNQATSSRYTGPAVSLFNNASNSHFTNSQVNTNVTYIQSSTGFDRLCEKSAMGALYSSLERRRLDAPKCHPNTRLAVIDRLIDWMTGKIDDSALMLWLYGAAGAGKSAIAHTVAEMCEKYGWLLATFFFWKTASERNNEGRVAATIAHQISLAIPATREYIGAAVDHNPGIFAQSIDIQLTKLIAEPLHQLQSTGFDFQDCPFLIIIDGLDECQGSLAQSDIVKSLITAFYQSPLRTRILIASRPEVNLQTIFGSSTLQCHLSRLALSHEYSSSGDIYRFLKDSFEKIRNEHPLASHIPSSWPSSDVIHEITRKSSGQFIFASTTINYVGRDLHELPTRRLDVIRQLQPARGEEDLPYAELNSLYHHVLSNVRNVGRVKQVLGVLFVVNPAVDEGTVRSTDGMDSFLFWQPGETQACLSQLASIIECGIDGEISILHSSLSDFLLDRTRSHKLHLCQESVLGDCAALALRHMSQPVNEDERFFFGAITKDLFWTHPICTPTLQQELNTFSLQACYDVFEMDGAHSHQTFRFWILLSYIFETLHNQNLENQYPRLISDLASVCVHAFEKTEPDPALSVLVYYEHYSHLLHIEALNPASVFPPFILSFLEFGPQTHRIIKKIVSEQTKLQRDMLTGQHYATVAQYFMDRHQVQSFHSLRFPHSLCPSEDVFNSSGNRKQGHSEALAVLLCIVHALPRACSSRQLLYQIFNPDGHLPCHWMSWNFHHYWTLNGWNDDIIQSARDAVFQYYKRYADRRDLENYIRINDLQRANNSH